MATKKIEATKATSKPAIAVSQKKNVVSPKPANSATKVTKAIAPKRQGASSALANAPLMKSGKATVESSIPKQTSGKRIAAAPAKAVGEIVSRTTEKPAKASLKSVTKKPVVSVPAEDIRIYQIYYRADQAPFVDPAFEPYNNAKDANPLLEFNVFNKIAAAEASSTKLWGALSWKFRQKTGLSGQDLIKIIRENPGYDVYFCNPHAETEALYYNLWLQGETSHPNFIELSKAVFEAADLDPGMLVEFQPSNQFATANYFVATPQFWATYLEFVKKVLRLSDQRLPAKYKIMLLSSAADAKKVHAGANYLPFIIERLFTVFLRTAGSKFKAFKYQTATSLSPENVHLKLLREMRDVAHSQNSLWMAACWVNYRNLYFSHMHDPAWIKKYLQTITPVQLRFSSSCSIALQAGS